MVSSWGDFAPSSVGDAMPSEKSLLKMIIKHKQDDKAIFLQACLPVSNAYGDPQNSPEEVTGRFGWWMLLNQQQHKESSA